MLPDYLTARLCAELLIEETAFLELAKKTLIDQFFEIKLGDFWITQFHEPLNVLQTIEPDVGFAHHAVNIIHVTIGGGALILYPQALGQDLHGAAFIGRIQYIGMAFDQTPQNVSRDSRLIVKIIGLDDQARSGECESYRVLQESSIPLWLISG